MASKINDLPVTTPGNESAPGVSADVPLPPNWKENLDDTVVSLVPYKLFPIDVNTLEYETVTELLQPFKIKTAEQIVNPMLWSRFVNTRKDLLLSKKTDDLALVSKLLLNDNKLIMQQAYIALNYDRHEQIVACPYSDNIALLFHCTNNPQNVEKILLEGLDERVGNGGNMGRGIYFAADPRKSATYDGCRGTMFIFMVLLGDCLSVNVNQIGARVKEPDKTQVQRRSVTDLHFDSIVGQPNRFYEYVIYNRYQCCPLYKISYDPSAVTNASMSTLYSDSKSQAPPFGWKSHDATKIPMPVRSPDSDDWPLLAKSIFAQMGVQQIEEADEVMDPLLLTESEESIEDKLNLLANLGFENKDMTMEILKKHAYDIDRTINDLLESSSNTAISETEILNNNKLTTLATLGFNDTELNERILKKHSYDLDKCVSDLLESGYFDANQTVETQDSFGGDGDTCEVDC